MYGMLFRQEPGVNVELCDALHHYQKQIKPFMIGGCVKLTVEAGTSGYDCTQTSSLTAVQ